MRVLSLSGFVAGLALSTAARPGLAQDFSELLREGPVVAVRHGANGKFDRAVAVADVKAPPDVVWRVISDFAHYHQFVPKLVKSNVKSGALMWA